jgi:hypothetical protein
MSAKTEKKARRQMATSGNGARDEAPPAKVERTKAPPTTIFCDELTIEIGGEKYHPHAGELVRLSGGASVADIKMAVDLQKFKDIDMSTDEGKARMEDVKVGLVGMVGSLAQRLQSWTWTDDAGRPYGEPTREILEGLRFEELIWILTASLKTARSDAERLKGSAPSTTS